MWSCELTNTFFYLGAIRVYTERDLFGLSLDFFELLRSK